MAPQADRELWAGKRRQAGACRQHAFVLLLLASGLMQICQPSARAQYLPPRYPEQPESAAGSESEPGKQGESRRGWEFHPSLAVEETYTDNVRLAAPGAERADWVTLVRPGFALRRRSPRLRLDLAYTPQLVYRAREETHDVFNYLNGSASGEVVSNLLYFDAQGYASRQNVSLLGPQAQNDVNRTGNRTSVRYYNVSPYLRHDFGLESRGELRVSHNAVDYGTSSLYSSEGDRVDASFASGPAHKAFTWNLGYTKDHTRYTDVHQSVDLERFSAGAKRLVTAQAGAIVNVGYEDNTYLTVGPPPRGKFWSVGGEWTPTPRTRLLATTGRRFFGPTHTLAFSHRTRSTTSSLDYDEDLTTGRAQALIPVTFDTASYLDTLLLPRIPDATARQTAVQSLMAQTGLPASLSAPLNYVTTLPFIQKRLRASFAVNGVRNTIVAHAFRQTRDVNAADVAVNQTGAGDLALSPRTVQTGAGAVWSLRLSPVTTTNASVDVTRNEFPAISREDKITVVRLALVKRFQPRVSGTVAYRRLQDRSNQAGASYRENAVMVGLNITF
jgi:uncharacterized protein (PEP-CTERM system associated)